MQKSPYVGEDKRAIEVLLGQDISTATDPYFLVRKPSGVTVTWAATKFEDDSGVTSGLRAVAKSTDLNEAGIYKIHPFLTLGDWTGPACDVIALTVRELFS